jgi:1-deoxy-D-xylulose-5-phosphate synthase
MLTWALQQDGPVAMRYARGGAPAIGPDARPALPSGQILREGSDAFFVGVGPVLGACVEAAETLAGEGVSVGVADARCVKPLDGGLLDKLAGMPLVAVEENTVQGGLGSAILEYYATSGRLQGTPMGFAGFPDAYVPHATRGEQLADLGLDAAGLRRTMQQTLAQVEQHSLK